MISANTIYNILLIFFVFISSVDVQNQWLKEQKLYQVLSANDPPFDDVQLTVLTLCVSSH